MKKKIFPFVLTFVSIISYAQQFEYKIITCVESIVPNGLGRSRLIDVEDKRNYKDFASEHSAGRNKSDRGDIRVENFEETKLLNFYNIGGIRFENIAANDALITSKLNELSNEGWELFQALSGVESDGGDKDGQGIYITRFLFRKLKK